MSFKAKMNSRRKETKARFRLMVRELLDPQFAGHVRSRHHYRFWGLSERVLDGTIESWSTP
jgi:hypothetical protein